MNSNFYIVNVEAAIYKIDQWLIVKRSDVEEHAGGTLALVGGKVEVTNVSNDILENTLKREILEEIGIEVYDEMRYVKSSFFVTQDGQPVIDIVFLCKYKSGDPKVLDPNELSLVEWMSAQEILNNKTIPIWTKDSIAKAQSIKNMFHFEQFSN